MNSELAESRRYWDLTRTSPTVSGRLQMHATESKAQPSSPEPTIDSLGLNSTNLNGPVPTGRSRICAGGTRHGCPGTSPTPQCDERELRTARFEPNAAAALVDKRALAGNSPDDILGGQYPRHLRPPRQVCLQAMQFSVLTKMAPQLVSRVSPGLQA
jgi:hypothetical protein